MRIAVGADENGRVMKDAVRDQLLALGHEVLDFGVGEAELRDYPDVAESVARAAAHGAVDRAVLVCGTGIGMAIAANKVRGIRAASVCDPYSAERAIKSNNAQVLCLGAKVVGIEVAKLLVSHWIAAEFAGGASARKVAKIDALDRKHSEAVDV